MWAKVDVKLGQKAPAYLGGPGACPPLENFYDLDSQRRILSHPWTPENSYNTVIFNNATAVCIKHISQLLKRTSSQWFVSLACWWPGLLTMHRCKVFDSCYTHRCLMAIPVTLQKQVGGSKCPLCPPCSYPSGLLHFSCTWSKVSTQLSSSSCSAVETLLQWAGE